VFEWFSLDDLDSQLGPVAPTWEGVQTGISRFKN